MTPTDRSEQIQWAASLYITQNMDISEIASLTGLDEADLAQLSAQHYWDDRRLASFAANQLQLQRLYLMLNDTTARSLAAGKDATRVDALLIKNYADAIRKLESQDGPIKTIQVAKPFTSWLLKKDPQLTRTITVYFDDYIKEQLRSQA